MKKLLFLLVVFTAFATVSCNDEIDREGPSIELIKPTAQQVFKPSDKVFVSMRLKDDLGVRSYEIESYSTSHNYLDIKIEKLLAYHITDGIITDSFTLPNNEGVDTQLPDGEYVLKITAYDIKGHVSEFMTTYKVQAQ